MKINLILPSFSSLLYPTHEAHMLIPGVDLSRSPQKILQFLFPLGHMSMPLLKILSSQLPI